MQTRVQVRYCTTTEGEITAENLAGDQLTELINPRGQPLTVAAASNVVVPGLRAAPQLIPAESDVISVPQQQLVQSGRNLAGRIGRNRFRG